MRHFHWHNDQDDYMYVDEEDGGGYRQGPKYWCNDDKKVVPGIRLREGPYDLSVLPGKYIWVYSGHPEFEKIIVEKDWGAITIVAQNSGAEKILPEHIEATLNNGEIKGSFKGIVPRKVAGCSNCFYIESVQWVKEWVNRVDEDGHGLSIAAEDDDNGHPFLVFYWNDGYGCHGAFGEYDIIAKKVSGTNDNGDFLSEAESQRLGIECTLEEIEKMANGGGSKDDDASSEDKREVEEEEEAGQTSILGTKRKAPDLPEEQSNPKTRKT
ncbi:uncharacterized protein EV420DRAFT_1570605 [Desarmillaria tabescens]|uniref:Uncharacterized protein n=1 Tax=Armillaria tabescens TaxID=1929756 RepID=A0AA39MTD7_ARMTA|nr:uncharacterized protein EV420DRAFT_1570605 [Desarmillaria tabescens]KAK0446431.1 hypothetical protein EV420DRAFT_1570605 [Desarmillaria tabescens]